MGNIYNYLMTAWQEERKNNLFILLAALVLVTIPLPYIFNSIAVGVFVLSTIFSSRNYKFSFQKILIYPIALYFLMALSIVWTIDFKITFEALSKELPLLLIPFCFFIIQFSNSEKLKILSYFSHAIFGFCIFYLIKAIVRYFLTNDVSVFFYHELVTLDLNAIHVSVYCVVSLFYFLVKINKSTFDKVAIVILTSVTILLSSKNIIITFIILLLIYAFFNRKNTIKKNYIYLFLILFIATSIFFFSKIKERFEIEIQSTATEKTINNSMSDKGPVYNVTINDAWNKDRFRHNDYFSGTALRVYQIRIFKELLHEENIFFTGFGLNASREKIKEKRIEHNLYPGYERFNFHNQYVQNFADLGVFGFILLIIMVLLTLKTAIKNKDFIHFSFAVLMISLFLTESFLWRQRGVVFFTMLYCLLNTNMIASKFKKEI